MDDCTSAVDMETEYEIQQAQEDHERRTTFIIAHRVSSVKDADEILFWITDGLLKEDT